MRRIAVTAAVLSIAAVLIGAQQKPDEVTSPKPPSKGDEVVVTGCISGQELEAHDTRRLGASEGLERSITYRLSGKKDLLKPLREDHEGHLEEITGVLQSTLPDPAQERGKKVGNTRIYIGGGAMPRSPMDNAMPARHLPVLEVKATRHINDRCGI